MFIQKMAYLCVVFGILMRALGDFLTLFLLGQFLFRWDILSEVLLRYFLGLN
jgi:hypothetical protein